MSGQTTMAGDGEVPEVQEDNTSFLKRSVQGVKMQVARLIYRNWLSDFRRNPIIGAAAVFSLLSAVYWLVIASDRYVSQAEIIVQQTDLMQPVTPDISSILAGDTAGNRHDQLILREYLLSRDVARELDKELELAEHYSGWLHDPLSRLSFVSNHDDFYEYFLSRVTVEYDEYAGVIIIRAQAFSPEMAQKISKGLVAAGEAFMNRLAQGLAQGQVAYLEGQVVELNNRAVAARQAVIAYQNREGIASPAAEAEAIGAIIANLEAQQTELQTELAAKRAYLVDDHPIIIGLQQQIGAIGKQIDAEGRRLAAPQGGRLNTKIEEFGRLEAEAKFAMDVYNTALSALEQTRFESTRKIKTLSVIQAPNLPQDAELPERLRQSIINALIAFIMAGVAQLIVMIVRDHKD